MVKLFASDVEKIGSCKSYSLFHGARIFRLITCRRFLATAFCALPDEVHSSSSSSLFPDHWLEK
jgi:hypothetical protein